jgi:hypothetical protein
MPELNDARAFAKQNNIPILAVKPRASVIAAGTLKNRENVFHAYDFGHPCNEAIDSLTKFTKGSRTPKNVEFMTRGRRQSPRAPNPPPL